MKRVIIYLLFSIVVKPALTQRTSNCDTFLIAKEDVNRRIFNYQSFEGIAKLVLYNDSYFEYEYISHGLYIFSCGKWYNTGQKLKINVDKSLWHTIFQRSKHARKINSYKWLDISIYQFEILNKNKIKKCKNPHI